MERESRQPCNVRMAPDWLLQSIKDEVAQDEGEWVPPFSLKFDPATVHQYTEEGRQVDCTTLARAAEAGQLDFLQWCARAGYVGHFDSAVLGYAMHASQRAVAEWLLCEDVINWQCWHAPYDQTHLVTEARLLGIDEALVARIPACRYAA